VAVADMFLKMTGVTGEAPDDDHKGEIQVVGWSWGLQAPAAMGGAPSTTGRAAMQELTVTKRVDQATPTLLQLARQHKVVSSAQLTVRKAGTTPLPYLKIELSNVRVTSVTTHSEATELVERLQLSWQKIRVTYTPQQSGTGAKGGGDVVFEADAYAGG
jgi:type VI secretion system secreted protein Hcp